MSNIIDIIQSADKICINNDDCGNYKFSLPIQIGRGSSWTEVILGRPFEGEDNVTWGIENNYYNMKNDICSTAIAVESISICTNTVVGGFGKKFLNIYNLTIFGKFNKIEITSALDSFDSPCLVMLKRPLTIF